MQWGISVDSYDYDLMYKILETDENQSQRHFFFFYNGISSVFCWFVFFNLSWQICTFDQQQNVLIFLTFEGSYYPPPTYKLLH